MKKIFLKAKELNLLNSLDIEFAQMIAIDSNQKILMLFSACLSADMRKGHTCLLLSHLTLKKIFNGNYPILAQQIWEKLGYPSDTDLLKSLLHSSAVSNGSYVTPLILDNERLYLNRIWKYECLIANFFRNSFTSFNVDQRKVKDVLNQLFINEENEKTINWQKIAVAVAITSSITFIYGGPGTGKSYTIAKIIAALLKLNSCDFGLKIIIAAPTGKAAIRLYESVSTAIQYVKLDIQQKKFLPKYGITLHQMLGATSYSKKMYHNSSNPIRADVLIIDEASMIDITMMANIILALPEKIRLIFLSDHSQIYSIESGSVIQELYNFSKIGYSKIRGKELFYLTGYKVPFSSLKTCNIANNSCFLVKNYRFNSNSGINLLANSVKNGNINKVINILNQKKYKDVKYLQLRNNFDYKYMINNCIAEYNNYLNLVFNNKSLTKIMNIFNNFRIICALHEGIFGVSGLNNLIEQTLLYTKSIYYIKINNHFYYSGKPIMVLSNISSLKLSNGDTGIILLNNEHIPYVYFLSSNNSIKKILLYRLSEYETAFAITIHKVQGSEFNTIALVLPNNNSPLLTRELLYTAITRARSKLLIYANNNIISYAIRNKTKRHSGLYNRLQNIH